MLSRRLDKIITYLKVELELDSRRVCFSNEMSMYDRVGRLLNAWTLSVAAGEPKSRSKNSEGTHIATHDLDVPYE
jgi:hypothetical protein